MVEVDPMWTEQFCALAGYNRWMNRKLYGIAAGLDDEQRKRSLGAFFGSVEGTLNHILIADRLWMARFTSDEGSYTSRDRYGVPIGFEGMSQIVYPVFVELRQNRDLLDRQIEFWVNHLGSEELLESITYFDTTGERHTHPLWQLLLHFFNHQTHHRGQVTTLLSQLGKDPGVTDFATYLRSEG